jgi:hypothetical protein
VSPAAHLCTRWLLGATWLALFSCTPDRTAVRQDEPRLRTESAPEPWVSDPVPPADAGTSPNLLQWALTRDPLTEDEPERSWRLPMKAKRMDVVLLSVVAHDDLEALRRVLTPDAQWGLPDRRLPRARSVFADDGGRAFIRALRTAASRLPEHPDWGTDMLIPGVSTSVRMGAEPMWTHFKQGWDTILVRKVHRDGRAWIDYVGFFETLPTQPIRIDVNSWGYPPPSSPSWKMPDGSIRQPPQQRPRIDMRPPEGSGPPRPRPNGGPELPEPGPE